ncbi:Uncharacterised protein [Yersinia pseudotuberculosis]|nr:Uncharacterised protein [Yersinia pseudotuberculosis]
MRMQANILWDYSYTGRMSFHYYHIERETAICATYCLRGCFFIQHHEFTVKTASPFLSLFLRNEKMPL